MTELFFLIISYFIGIIFINTSISKIKEFQIHLINIKNYSIIKRGAIIKVFAIVSTISEIFIAFSFFTISNIKAASILAISLLIVYSTAVLLNLLHGRTKISCGCGGAFESSNLSWSLLYRNASLIILVLINLIISQSTNLVFSLEYFPQYSLVMILSLLIGITVLCYVQILKLNSER